MFEKDTILSKLKAAKPFLQNEMGVRRIGLFGSYAKEGQTEESDVDIYLELEDNSYKKILSVLLYLEGIIGKKVDLVYKGEHLRQSFLQTLETETLYV